MRVHAKEILAVMLFISVLFTAVPINTYAENTSLTVTWLTQNYDEVYDFYYGAARVKKGSKWGLIDKTGKQIAPVVYDVILGFEYDFKDGMALFMNKGKYGLINSKGKIIAPAVYDQIEPFSEGLARVSKGGKFGFINTIGKVVVPLKYDRANLGFKEGLSAVAVKVGNDRTGYKFGYIDKNGKEVIPLKYTFANDFSEGLAWVATGKSYNVKYGAINKYGKTIIPFKYIEVRDFSSGIARVDEGGNNDHYINKTGKVVISSGFDNGSDCKEGMVWTESLVGYGSWYTLRDNTGKKIPLDGPIYSASDFKDGLSRISKQGGYSTFIDKKGKEIYHAVSSISEFKDGYALVQDIVGDQAKYGMIDRTGKVVVPFMYDSIGDFSEGLAVARMGQKNGFIDKTGNLVLEIPYYSARAFKEGLAVVHEGMHDGVIDKTGKLIVPVTYQNINDFKEGNAIVTDDNFKKGVVDQRGEVVVPLDFNEIRDFNDGMAIAKKGDKWAIIKNSNR